MATVGTHRRNGPRRPSWIVPHQTAPKVGVRLYCFPHAGVGASIYRAWSDQLPGVDVCPVQLPGRGARLREPALSDLGRLAELVTEGLRPQLDDLPFALFGHSMGALVAFEFARRLRTTPEAPSPCHLFISGWPAPRLAHRFPPIGHLPDDAFLAAVDRRYGAVPKEVAADPELLKLLIPCLRSDFTATETYEYREEAPLACPITALSGVDDGTTLPEEVEGWRQETTGPFAFVLLPGNHFFIDTARAQVIRTVAQALQDGGVHPCSRESTNDSS